MKSLVRGLESCPSLVELAVRALLSRKAKRELVRYMGTSRSAEACNMRRLYLTDHSDAAERFPSILTVAANGQQSATTSLGSCLRLLSLPNKFEDISELLNVLVVGEHRLSSLSLRCLTDTSWLQLSHALPKLLHLREFHLVYLDKEDASTADFVRAMRQNGSLHRVSDMSICSPGWRREPLFSADELLEIQSYCQRNLKMRELLQDPYLPDDDTREVKTKTLLSLFPKLFQAMKPAQRVAPTHILAGLLACSGGSDGGCLIGPSGHSKRLGPLLSDEQ
jgi:hypothetical protein